MKTEYQPKVQDKKNEIRNAVAKIRKNTGLDKAVIVEKLLKYAISHSLEIFN